MARSILDPNGPGNTAATLRYNRGMESDRVNLIENASTTSRALRGAAEVPLTTTPRSRAW